MTKFLELKKRVIIAIAALSFLVAAHQTICAETLNSTASEGKWSHSHTKMIAQNETDTSAGDKETPASENSESKSKTDNKKKSSTAKKQTLKDFKPSERIEAEQAVDFPYDI